MQRHGFARDALIVIATNHNNLAMNRGILQAAKHFALLQSRFAALMSRQLYGRVPEGSYLLAVGAQSSGFSLSLSPAVHRAIPEALSRINSLLSGATYSPSAPKGFVAS